MKNTILKYKNYNVKKSNFVDGKYILKNNFHNEIKKVVDSSAIKEQKKEIDRQNALIIQLKEEIKDLKEEIELLRAVNQEC
jgi:hypothetical protein